MKYIKLFEEFTPSDKMYKNIEKLVKTGKNIVFVSKARATHFRLDVLDILKTNKKTFEDVGTVISKSYENIETDYLVFQTIEKLNKNAVEQMGQAIDSKVASFIIFISSDYELEKLKTIIDKFTTIDRRTF
jgi:hypothetical protein